MLRPFMSCVWSKTFSVSLDFLAQFCLEVNPTLGCRTFGLNKEQSVSKVMLSVTRTLVYLYYMPRCHVVRLGGCNTKLC